MSKKINVTFEGRVVGTAKVDMNSGIAEVEIESSDLKYILPDYDPTAGLSIAEVQDQIMGEYTDSDISIAEAYFKNFPKGTFDA
jgi:hypothetical protein